MVRITIRRIVFFLAFINATLLCAQHSGYYIRNYLPKEYNGFNQVWHAVQDEAGLIYFAGTSNIFIYNGNTFDLIPVKPGMANRQIVRDSATGIIYVGSVGEFGYLARDSSNGKFSFHSMTGILNENQKQFSDVWKVFVLGSKTYFQSSERIFICENKKVIDVIEATKEQTFALMFCSNGHLFVRQRNAGLMEIKGNKLTLLPGGERFATMRLMNIIPWNASDNLILSGDSGFFLMTKNPGSSGTVFKAIGAGDAFLFSGAALGCKWVNDSIFAINSRAGIGFYDKHLQLREVLDKKSGLSDGSIAEILVDKQKNLWLMHNNGISKLCYNSPVLFFPDDIGYSGTNEMMIRYNGKLMLATTEGLFESVAEPGPFSSALQFQRVPEIPQTEVWHITDINGDLYVGATDGLFYIHEGKTTRISNRVSNRIRYLPSENELLVLEKGGLTAYRVLPGKAPVEIKHFDFPGEDFIQSSEPTVSKNKPGRREVWLVNRNKTFVHLYYSISSDEINIDEYTSTNGFPVTQFYPTTIGDSVYFLTVLAAYRYIPRYDLNDSSTCFAPAPDIYDALYNGKVNPSGVNMDFRIFIQVPRFPKTTIFGYDANNQIISRQIYLFYFSGDHELQFTFCEPGNISWILSNDRIVRCDELKKVDADIPYNAIISNVTVGRDTIFFGSDNTSYVYKEPLSYSRNSVTFTFAAAFYDYDQGLQYEYFLDGLDTAWMHSNTQFEKNYSKLSEGTYTFRIRFFNELGKYSNEGSFTFTILPPWYRTIWAYSLYAILFIGSIYLSIRLGARRLRIQKEKLEITVAERTAEVVEQNHKIEKQNFELESAYKGIKDSIHYAERIQHAILPVTSEFENSFSDSFVFFIPRDIVSGDFYWMVRRGPLSVIACVDCTGHGVPGAFMSMIGNTILNEIVLEKNIVSPEKILNLLHIRVRQALRQDSGGETRDGMDISICHVDHEKNRLSYAGANRALWIIRDKALTIIQPDKFSIGGYQIGKERRFTLHEMQIKKGDCIYMTTDGYADQFGGAKGKKFMVKRFQQLLLDISDLSMSQQKEYIERTFFSWKDFKTKEGNANKLEQVDDVLVIGFRINN
ncbi:hypothetical protein BH11BAC7_BH11BAC7_02990 [soil metagenome]